MRLADRSPPGGQQEQSLLPHRLVSLTKRKIVPALLGFGVMLSSGLSTTSPADALSSGSSYGGSSFHSSSPSYSRPSSSYSYHSYSTPSYRPSYRPTYTNIDTNTYYTRPYSHSHTHKNGDPLTEKEEEELESEVSGFILFVDLAALSALIFDGVKPFGVSVVKIQLAVKTDWLDPSGPMRILSKECAKKEFAAGNGSPTREELGELTWSILYAMGCRFNGEWKAASLEGNYILRPFPGWASKVGERRFATLVAAERAKFETCNPRNPPPLPVTPGDPASELVRRVEGFVSAANAWGKTVVVPLQPTMAVVTVIAVVRGPAAALSHLPSFSPRGRRRGPFKVDVENAMISLRDEGIGYPPNVLAFEVLWSPSGAGDVVTEAELETEFPNLIPIVKGEPEPEDTRWFKLPF